MNAEPQVLVQYPYAGGNGEHCRGIAGLPVAAPAQIAVVPGGSANAARAAEELGAELFDRVLRSAAGAAEVGTRCHGHCMGLTVCYAQRNTACRNLLVLLGAGPDPTAVPAEWTWITQDWPGPHANGVVLPVLPAGADPVKWLPAAVAGVNGWFWNRSPLEAVPAVLSRAGVVPEEWRVFISYRRQHSAGIADQLFDALSHRGWDVFLDRFQLPAGIDFEARLADELREKVMVVFLETPGFLGSDWTRFEVAAARKHRLWMVPVHLPGGQRLPGLHRSRIRVREDQVSGSAAAATLSDPELARVVDHLVAEHSRGVLWRRSYMDDLVRAALLKVGERPAPGSGAGLIHVGGYCIRTSPYPPGVREFHDADRGRAAPPVCNVLVGPAALRERDRAERIRWLSGKADVRLVDEAAVLPAARAIHSGTLK